MTTHPTCRAADANMVEIVARAIYALHPLQDDEFDGEGYDIDGPRTLTWEDCVGMGLETVFLDEARAAIAAYEAALAASGYVIVPRVPTDAMWDAGHAALEIHGESARASCWAFVAMIDAALAQSAPPAKPHEGTSS